MPAPRMDMKTLLALAQNAIDEGNIAAACDFYELAHQQYPAAVPVLEAYGEVMLHHVGDRDRAETMLRHAIMINPEEGYVKYLNLAQIVVGEEAVACYRKALSLMDRELSLLRGQNKAKARRAAVALRREAANAYAALAELYLTDLCDSENAEEACEQALTKALEYADDVVEVYQTRGSLRLSQQRPVEAAGELRRALELSYALPESRQPTYESKIELAKLMMQIHLKVEPSEAGESSASPPPSMLKEAFTFLLEILQMDDTNPYVWFLLGETARLRQRYPDAARLFAHARNLLRIIKSIADEERAKALEEVDNSIRLLIQDIGGEANLAQISDIGTPRPLELLQPEDDDEVNPDENAADDPAADDAVPQRDEEQENDWEDVDEEDDDERNNEEDDD